VRTGDVFLWLAVVFVFFHFQQILRTELKCLMAGPVLITCSEVCLSLKAHVPGRKNKWFYLYTSNVLDKTQASHVILHLHCSSERIRSRM
jgi:hypothetical protein